MPSLRIAYVGNFQPARHLRHLPGVAPWSTETHLAASLEALGHTVTRIQEDAEQGGPQQVAEVERAAEGCDLFLWTRTWGLAGDAHGMLARFAARGIPTVAYHLDLYAGLPRAKDVGTEPWWRCQYVFTADGGSEAFWQAHQIRHFWMPPGVYHAECYLAEPDPALACDVAFVGSRGYHPEWTYRPQLLDWLGQTYGSRFRLVGDHPSRTFRGARLNAFYASAKVLVGDSLVQGFTHARYWSDRLPETLGRGGALIFPRIPGLADDGYVDGEHFTGYDFGDFAGLRAAIDGLLADPTERARRRLAGHAFVRDGKTYVHRLAAMLREVAAHEPALAARLA